MHVIKTRRFPGDTHLAEWDVLAVVRRQVGARRRVPVMTDPIGDTGNGMRSLDGNVAIVSDTQHGARHRQQHGNELKRDTRPE